MLKEAKEDVSEGRDLANSADGRIKEISRFGGDSLGSREVC